MNIAKWIFAIVLAAFSLPALSCPQPDCVRIGSWNIAWLGSEKRKQSSDAATIEAMAERIANEWSIDLISLQEINTSIDGSLRGEHYSTQQWNRLRNALQKRGYNTVVGSSGNAQHVVLAWRKPVVVLQVASDMQVPDSYRIDDYCYSSNLRKPLAGLFRAGQFDFWAIGLHLKSGYGGQSACTNAVRKMQVYYIAKQLDTMKKSDKDIVIIGDFNASGNHESLRNLHDKGFKVLTYKNDRHEASNSRTQGSGKRGGIIDHVMIDHENTGEWKIKSTVLYNPEDAAAFNELYSDHFPVWSDFSITNDDD